MSQPLTFSTAMLLTLAPLLWAGNAVVGRLVYEAVPPVTLNLFRWAIAFVIVLPLALPVFRRGSSLWRNWRRYCLLGLLGIGVYNTLLYLALHTSTPMNITLVAASMPVWMLGVGWMFFGAKVSRRQMVGTVLSIGGVVFVLSRGQLEQILALRLVQGDILILLATIAWSFYSWLLMRGKDEPDVTQNWATSLAAQLSFGLLWSAVFAAGEWTFTDVQVQWSWGLIAALLFVAIGPALIALRSWGVGVKRVGPSIAAFFNNLTPLFAALMSAAFLGESPQMYHVIAFVLIVAGIVVSARR